MNRSKTLSMKKLYEMMIDFTTTEKLLHNATARKNAMDVIRWFLEYVWQHRND